MNADAFRHVYGYHFSENRKVWDYCTQLTDAQFTRPTTYSRGSVRDQVIHLISVDETWFCGLRNVDLPEPADPTSMFHRQDIREYWNTVEQKMRDYLATLRDEMLFDRPFPEGEDQNLIVWQVLLHVINHGTDHRAQILRQLNDLGVNTIYQDYIFYTYENP